MATVKFADMLRTAPPVAGAQDSREWVRQQAQRVAKPKADPMRAIRKADSQLLQSTILLGHMYLFYYEPKFEQQLPFYDQFPLIFPFRKVKGGFYGLNMHYLPPVLRARLMDALYDTVSDDRMDDLTKLRINYRILSGTAKFKWFAPCVKHYLNTHVKSRFLHVHPSDWEKALFLPLERFQKATKTQVFADSKRKLGM